MQVYGGGDKILQRSDVPQWNLIPDTSQEFKTITIAKGNYFPEKYVYQVPYDCPCTFSAVIENDSKYDIVAHMDGNGDGADSNVIAAKSTGKAVVRLENNKGVYYRTKNRVNVDSDIAFKVKEEKLEKGYTATGWQPSISDLVFKSQKPLTAQDINGGGVNLLRGTMDGSCFQNGDNNPGIELETSNAPENAEINSWGHGSIIHLWGDNLQRCCLQYKRDIFLPAGTYTLSFLARTNGASTNDLSTLPLGIYSSYTNIHGSQPFTSINVGPNWSQCSGTFYLPESTTHSALRVVDWSTALIPGGSIYFANVKLECGPTATPYTPSPFDLWDKIISIESKINK